MIRPLVSVIVPVYQVEPWLETCVSSIRRQTYRNLEIILVDDGSTDASGTICDRIAAEDKRVVVIHRENGGLSVARNTGLDACSGEFIGFVDSDDFIHPQMYERLLGDISEFRTRLSFCQALLFKGENTSFPCISAESECKPSGNVIAEALKNNKWYSAWTKLYHRSLFDGIRYPDGRNNEDYPVTLRIFDRCDRIAINHNALYAYRRRPGSITTSSLNPHSFDQVVNAEDVYAFIRERHPESSAWAAGNLLSCCVGLLLKTEGQLAHTYGAQREMLFRIIRKYYPDNKKNPSLSPAQRQLLAAADKGKTWYAVAVRVYSFLQKTK